MYWRKLNQAGSRAIAFEDLISTSLELAPNEAAKSFCLANVPEKDNAARPNSFRRLPTINFCQREKQPVLAAINAKTQTGQIRNHNGREN